MLVVGNPANTNAFITMRNAPSIPRRNFTALTRLDQVRVCPLNQLHTATALLIAAGSASVLQNRAKAQLAARAKVKPERIKNVIIWGNHSATQVSARLRPNTCHHMLTHSLTHSLTTKMHPLCSSLMLALLSLSAVMALVSRMASLVLWTRPGSAAALCRLCSSVVPRSSRCGAFPAPRLLPTLSVTMCVTGATAHRAKSLYELPRVPVCPCVLTCGWKA